MVSRTVVVVIVGLCAAGIGLLASFGVDLGSLTSRTVPRIKVSVDADVSGKPVSGEWVIPAIRHWDFPEYWLQGGTDSFRTVRSPFDTVFMRLPTGEGIGVDLREAKFNMPWIWRPSPIEDRRTLYYLLDSIDHPRVLIDYAITAQRESNCPKGDLILGCRISSTMTLLKAGPLQVPTGVGGSGLFAQRAGAKRYNELRQFGLEPPKPMIFVYMVATVFRSSGFRADLELEPSLGAIARPTIAWIDRPTRNRLLKGKTGTSVNLAYDGANSWSLDDAESRHPRGWAQLHTAHLTEVLTGDDLVCCQWPDTQIKKDKIEAILATIRYLGGVVPYGPAPASSDKTPVLIDPNSETVVTFYGPQAKVIWMLPPK